MGHSLTYGEGPRDDPGTLSSSGRSVPVRHRALGARCRRRACLGRVRKVPPAVRRPALPQALRAGGTPTRRTGRPPAYNQYAGARPALPPALRAGGTPRARAGRRSARPTGGRRDFTDTT
ncbi:hypothetical protein DC008_17460 [Streptomyces nigra]|nr:hypothetical protein DC008_17460 [Streptomyces nigra]